MYEFLYLLINILMMFLVKKDTSKWAVFYVSFFGFSILSDFIGDAWKYFFYYNVAFFFSALSLFQAMIFAACYEILEQEKFKRPFTLLIIIALMNMPVQYLVGFDIVKKIAFTSIAMYSVVVVISYLTLRWYLTQKRLAELPIVLFLMAQIYYYAISLSYSASINLLWIINPIRANELHWIFESSAIIWHIMMIASFLLEIKFLSRFKSEEPQRLLISNS